MGIKKCWLKAWHSAGRLKELQALLLGDAQNEGLICWKSGVAGVAHGYKGKSVLIHLLAASKLIETVAIKTAKAAQEREKAGGRHMMLTRGGILLNKSHKDYLYQHMMLETEILTLIQ